MNALLNNDQRYYDLDAGEETNTQTFGETFAIAFITLMVALILILSSWSALLIFLGETSNGGPIGFLFGLFRMAVLM